MISALCNTADWNNRRTQNTNQQRKQHPTYFKGKSIISLLLSLPFKVQNIIFSIHYSAWYKNQLHSSHLNLQKRFLYLRLMFERLHFKIHATTFLYTVLSNILQNVTLNYFKHLKAGCTILAIGCYRPLLPLNQELLGENETLELAGQLKVANICCTKPTI
jgi:hypothetical protein